MTDDRWQEVMGMVKDKFTILEQGKTELSDRPGVAEFVCFMGPGEKKMKLERVSYPLVTGKKTMGSRRVGGTTSVEYQYSDTEMVHKMHVYQWDAISDTWQEIKSQNFFT